MQDGMGRGYGLHGHIPRRTWKSVGEVVSGPEPRTVGALVTGDVCVVVRDRQTDSQTASREGGFCASESSLASTFFASFAHARTFCCLSCGCPGAQASRCPGVQLPRWPVTVSLRRNRAFSSAGRGSAPSSQLSTAVATSSPPF